MEKIVFKNPYHFEGTEYKEIDLSGLETMTGAELIAAQRMLDKSNVLLPEADYQYVLSLAAKAASLPIEFFNGLPAHDAVMVKMTVSGFLFNGE